MANTYAVAAPNLKSFLKSLKVDGISDESSIQCFIERRQIRGSRPCAIATAHLLQKVISSLKISDAAGMIKRVQAIGQRVAEAQPREIAVSNIVRRVLGVIREEAEGDEGAETGSLIGDSSTPETPKEPVTHIQSGVAYPFQNDLSLGMRLEGASFASAETEASHRPPLLTSHTSYATSTTAPTVTSMFSLLSHPLSSRGSTPGTQSPIQRGSPRPSILPPSHDTSKEDLRAEVSNGIEEIIDEISIVDDQIASYAPEHIHENEIILTHGSSFTVQKFLLKAASKRKFTVIHAEGFPNTHREVHALVTGKGPNGVPLTTDPSSEDDLGLDRFSKPLIAAGITVILIPDAAVFALMSRVNKVILGTHIVLANGGLIAIAGSKVIAKAAHEHRTPVVVVTGVYKLSPTYPFDFDALIEHGEPGPVLGWDEDGEYVEKIDVENPLHDYVPGELVDLYVTNLGGCAPFALASVVEEQYRAEDLEIGSVWQGK